jgi:hypothetical protein
MNNNPEQSSRQPVDIVAEVKGYRQTQYVHAVNRDGDMHFIECPECHTTNVNSLRLFGCKKCHTRFSLYGEDGFQTYCVESESGTVNPFDKKITLLRLKSNDWFLKNHLPRNDGTLDDLKKEFPDMKVIKLYQDLDRISGKDAHGHEKYKRYALIPLN